MLQRIREYIQQHNMLEKEDRIVIGVSGGADSICLLYAFFEICKDYAAELNVVHINHGLRGEEADQDEQFVMELCKSLDIRYHSFYYDVEEIAKKEGLSKEEAGRKVRYQSFYDICKRRKCNKLAIAHNKNDNAETVLFHLFRGSGIKGLSGIEPKRKVHIEDMDITLIRPLLCVERAEIEEFLAKRGIPYRIDATNLTNDYSRNKIRNQVLAYVSQEINHNAIKNITEAATHLGEINQYISEVIEQHYPTLVRQKEHALLFSVKELIRENIVIQKGMIKKAMENLAGHSKDLEAKHVNQVLALSEKQVGKVVHLPYGMLATREYDDIRLSCNRDESKSGQDKTSIRKPIELIIPGRIALPEKQLILEAIVIPYEKNMEIPKNCCMKWFDYDKIENTLVIRTRNEGDYIQINRMGGRKKLKDYLIDHKIPRQERDHILLIADGSHILWMIGAADRISENYKVDENTKNILLMKLMKAEEDKND